MADQLMGLLNSEADVSYRGGLLPLLRRVIPDIGGDDISEFEGPLEFATPALAYDPVRNMALTGAMLRGQIPVDEGLLTQTMVDAPLVGGLLAGATGAVPKGAVLGANVFHGGPHRFAPEPDFPFGRPRLDKVGTGEGAQAYGYGFYSADAPGVARQYRDDLAFKRGSRDMAEMLFGQKSGDVDAAIKSLKNEIAQYDSKGWPSPDYRVQYDEALAKLEGFKLNPPDKGFLYKLDIPDADVAKYLDWDKPLSEQPKDVQAFIKNLRDEFDRLPDYDPNRELTPVQKIAIEVKHMLDSPQSGYAGKDFYYKVSDAFGGDQAASEALRKAGIPGLKYFDQDSRPLGDTIGQTLVVRGKEIDSDDLTGSFAANRLLESNMDFDAAKRIARGMGQDDVVKVLDDWATTPDKVSIKDKRTRNYVTWDQDVLNRSKMLERDGVTLGANKGPTAALPGLLSDAGKGSGAAHARPLNPTRRTLKGINDSPDDIQPPKENFSAVENVYNLYFYNQNIPPKTAEKIKAVIQKHTATNDLNTAEQAMLGPALDEVKALQNAAKNKARKPRWPSKIDLTTIDGVASALKQKLGGGAISGKPWNSRYFDVGENSRLRISDHLAATRRSANNSGEVIVSYGNKGINFDVGDNSLTIPYNDKRLSNRDGLQELIDLVEGSDAIELGANKGPTAALPGLLEQQYMEDSERLLRDSQGLLGATQRRNNQLNALQQFYASGGV